MSVLVLASLVCAVSFQEEGSGAEDVPLAIQSGVDFLVESQNENGSWGGVKNATFTSGFANPATYKCWQIGASALATRALLELGVVEEERDSAVRGLRFVMANDSPKRPADWDVDNNWAILYALDTVAFALQDARFQGTELEEELRASGARLLAGLAKYQSPRGGWGYYSDSISNWRPDWATSFTTAVAVLAMVEAKEAGLEVDPHVFETGVRALERSRLPNGAYDYEVGAVPRHMRLESINQVKGSLGRIQVCNLALYRAKSSLISLDDLVEGLEQFVKHHKFLDVARNKPIPHEAYYANAAYFYLFAHYYAARVLRVLPEEERAKFAPHVRAGILKTQQKDGSMWDFWIASNTRAYGTAFGALGLEKAQPGQQ